MTESIQIAKISSNAVTPTRKHSQDAGLDLYANEKALIPPFSQAIVTTGICINTPEGHVGLVLSKSKNNFLLGGGVVDAGYQGEILIKVINPFSEALLIEAGQAIAQYLLVPIETPTVVEILPEEFFQTKTDRGESGGILSQKKAES